MMLTDGLQRKEDQGLIILTWGLLIAPLDPRMKTETGHTHRKPLAVQDVIY